MIDRTTRNSNPFDRHHSAQRCLAALALIYGLASLASADSPEISTIAEEPPITSFDRDHWSFRPLRRPEVPEVQDTTWPRNPVDCFILHKIEAAGLKPMPSTDRRTLIRRVTFDLTGLPPTPEQIRQFLQDRSPQAYARLVDRLLASSAYGERWAQHWLDLARFAETDGFEFDHVREEAWRYRDWVIDAHNRDLPYNAFVRMQLAGDELHPDDPSARCATGYLLCGPDMPDINLQEERRHTFLNDLTATVGATFLGLQVGCAQCHDHKFDPISQLDFYRFRAFFDPAVEFERNKSITALSTGNHQVRSYFQVRGDFRRRGPEVSPAFPRIANRWGTQVSLHEESEMASRDGRRSALARWMTRPDHPLVTRVIVNRLWQHHFGRGLVHSASDFGLMGDWPSHPELLDWLATELPRQDWSLKRLHRLIVTSSTYRQASRPGNSAWNEQQQRMARERWEASQQVDPDNELLARMPRRRLEGEAIRDAMLAASDQLNRKMGGPGIRPPLPEELVSTLLKNQWPVTADESQHRRRSIYVFVRRNLSYPMFDLFDKPDTNVSCARRNRSTIAPQSLMLLNSQFSLSAARALCDYLLEHAGSDPSAQIELCYLRTLGRPPTHTEQQIAQEFLIQGAARLQAEGRDVQDLAVPEPLPADANHYQLAALTDFCLAIFNLNEFVYVD